MSTAKTGVNPMSPIRVSANGRYFVDRGGKPFFWLGDTEWELLRMFTEEDALSVLADRKAKGINVILAMLLGTHDDKHGPGANLAGETPWTNGDPLKPNEKYFEQVDRMIGLGEQTAQVFVVGVYHKWHVKAITEANARAWARWVAARYRNIPNLVWCMYPQAKEEFKGVCRELAGGLAEGDGGAHLIGIHPDPSPASSSFMHSEPWLAFNMIQTWNDYDLIEGMAHADYARTPAKPVVMAEGGYETSRKGERVVTAHEAHKQAWWSQLAGGFHVYGHDGNWRRPTKWREWLDAPGTHGLRVFQKFMTGLDGWWEMTPDQTILASGAGSGFELNMSARSASGKWAVVYVSTPGTVAVRMDALKTRGKLKAEWMDPRNGERSEAGKFAPSTVMEFTTPAGWEDAVLYLAGT